MTETMHKETGAVAAAPASMSADVATPAAGFYSQSDGTANAKRKARRRGEPVIGARGPLGRFIVTGQTARALVALVGAGKHGITALEVNSWAYRLGAYVHLLRHEYGLAIETAHENHEGGWHARYILRSPVVLLEAGQ